MRTGRSFFCVGLVMMGAVSGIAGGVQAGEPSGGDPSKDSCRDSAYHAAQMLAGLRMPGATFENGGVNLLNLDRKAGSALYEFDVLDRDPRHPDVWPGHNIIRVTVETGNCAPKAIQFVETFM